MNYDPVLARALLARTPGVLRAWLPGLPAEWLDAPAGPSAWSVRDVACHLADLEGDDWWPRVRMILERAERPFPKVDRERFRERFAGASLDAVVDAFEAARARNLEALEALAPNATLLELRGWHPDLGAVTLGQLLSTWVVHDLTHLAQISRTLAVRYRDAVGPWSAYLGVLRPRS